MNFWEECLIFSLIFWCIFDYGVVSHLDIFWLNRKKISHIFITRCKQNETYRSKKRNYSVTPQKEPRFLKMCTITFFRVTISLFKLLLYIKPRFMRSFNYTFFEWRTRYCIKAISFKSYLVKTYGTLLPYLTAGKNRAEV